MKSTCSYTTPLFQRHQILPLGEHLRLYTVCQLLATLEVSFTMFSGLTLVSTIAAKTTLYFLSKINSLYVYRTY